MYLFCVFQPKTFWHITAQQSTSQQSTSHHSKVHHITSHHITSHHITSHHISSHHISSHHITSHHITSHLISSHHNTLHHHMRKLTVNTLTSAFSYGILPANLTFTTETIKSTVCVKCDYTMGSNTPVI